MMRENSRGALLDELEEVFDEFRSVQPPPGLKEQILSATVWRRRRFVKLGLAAACAAFIGISASLLTLNPFSERSLSKEETQVVIDALLQPAEIIRNSSLMLIESIIFCFKAIEETNEGGVKI